MWQGIKNVYHLFNAFLACLWFGFPSRELTVIGVTGTDGKTTTVSLIYHILNKAHYNASMISSVGAIIGGKEYDVGFHVTTPSPWGLQKFIKEALRSPRQFDDSSNPVLSSSLNLARAKLSKIGYREKLFKSSSHAEAPRAYNYLVLETTSHALDQHRVFGIKFDIGVLTNVTHEHLDYHKTYENYVMTKIKLLQKSKVSVMNKDDTSYKLISSKLKTPVFAKATAGRQNSKLQLKIQKLITYGMGVNSEVNPKVFPFKTNLIGEFNTYNVLAAVAACKVLGITDRDIRKGIESFKPPIGREEIVYKKDFTVMIDFAHTPNAFEQILSSIKPNIKGRLIHVFGAAGQRDASKRPLMGKVSSKYSDVIVLTAEDPRSESVEKIIKEIESGITNPKSEIRNSKQFSKFKFSNVQNNDKYIFEIPDRREAINTAIRMARKGDFVLITGKSHEKSVNYGKGEEPWDEFEVVRKALRNLSGRSPRRSR